MKTPPRPDIWNNSPWAQTILESTDDAVMITDTLFHVVKWNTALSQLLPDQKDTPADNTIIEILEKIQCDTEGINEKLLQLLKTGSLEEEIILTGSNGTPLYLSCYIHKLPGTNKVSAVVVIIRDLKKQVHAIHSSDSFYKTLFDTLREGVLLVTGHNATVIAGNKRAWEILRVPEKLIIGQNLLYTSWKIIHEDGRVCNHDDLPPNITLNTGETVENTVLGIKRPSGKITWLSVNSSYFSQGTDSFPRCAVVSFTDITAEKTAKTNADEELRSSNERFSFVLKAISDYIWDWDIETGQIYRSESLTKFTGHTEESIENNQNWWFERVHPDDLERVRNNISTCLNKGNAHWHDEYRFRCADNSYKHIIDKGYIIYKDGKAIRAIGAVQDVTENKRLEAKLQLHKIRQHRAINRAIIMTQDHERNELGKELHDNVNQILATASLFLNHAKGVSVKEKKEYTERSNEYIQLAIEELRKISKSLNTSIVEQAGLKEPLKDLVQNLLLHPSMSVRLEYGDDVEHGLSAEQKLMMYRIIQEQTNNIIKYAEADKISIIIRKEKKSFLLAISDNGKGFDPKQSCKGIGLANIRHRVEAFNGIMKIDTTPGKGCSLEVSIPG